MYVVIYPHLLLMLYRIGTYRYISMQITLVDKRLAQQITTTHSLRTIIDTRFLTDTLKKTIDNIIFDARHTIQTKRQTSNT